MKKIKTKLIESAALKNLRKKLFIAAAYLLVVASLLGYVTYAQYRIRIEGKVHMPTAATFEASIELFPCEAKTGEEPEDPEAMGGKSWQQVLLADLGPGDSVTKNAEEENDTRCMKVTARNWYTVGTEEAETIISQVPIRFSFRIEGTGFLPLEFILTEVAGSAQYHSKVTVNSDGSRSYTFADGSGNEPSFIVGEAYKEGGTGERAKEEKQFFIYVGWDGNYEDGAYRKEVERLKIGAIPVGADVGHEILSQTDLETELAKHQSPAETGTEEAAAPEKDPTEVPSEE